MTCLHFRSYLVYKINRELQLTMATQWGSSQWQQRNIAYHDNKGAYLTTVTKEHNSLWLQRDIAHHERNITHHSYTRCPWVFQNKPYLHLEAFPSLVLINVDMDSFILQTSVKGVEDGFVLDVWAVVSPAARFYTILVDMPIVQFSLHNGTTYL